jgi:glycosyl transferase family 25
MNQISETLLTHFDRIYIGNLPSRTDRRREMAELLGKVGLSLDDSQIHLFPADRPTEQGDWSSIGAHGAAL